MSDPLPPGCAKLSFDLQNRETWGNKIVVLGDGERRQARIVDIDIGGLPLLVTIPLSDSKGERFATWFPSDGNNGATRLYDAAPERPEKPREWFCAEKKSDRDYPMLFHTEKERADWLNKRERTLNDASTFRQYRLIEAPEDGK